MGTDPEEALKVLRGALEAGVSHIDTSDYYGPHVTNQIIKQAVHRYADGLVIVTKVGARRNRNRILADDAGTIRKLLRFV